MWLQEEIELGARARGFHLITEAVTRGLPKLREVVIGHLHLFILHTSASLCLSENASPDVPRDLEDFFDEVAPERSNFRHSLEGPDDMPAHIKAVLLGSSIHLPVRDGKLCLGTWQGIFLCEHRNQGGPRKLLATLHGQL